MADQYATGFHFQIRYSLYKGLLFLLFGIGIWSALAAQPSFSSFVHYTTDQGLSDDYIRDVVRDQQGFLWVATLRGLNRFDGHSFRQFFKNTPGAEALQDDLVNSLCIAPDGSIWISTNFGICRLDPVHLEFTPFPLPENEDELANDLVSNVEFDEEGRGWVYAEKAVHSFDPVTCEITTYPLPVISSGPFGAYLDRDGRFWRSRGGQVSYFNIHSKTFRHFYTEIPDHPLRGAAPLGVMEDHCGNLWITSWFRGLLHYDPVLDSLIDVPDDNPVTTQILADVAPDGSPFLWLGGGHSGLYHYFPETGESIQFPADPRDNYTHNNYIATSYFRDLADGSVWIGTEAGLEHYAPSALRFNRVVLPIAPEFGQFSLMSGAMQDCKDATGNTYYISMWGSGIFKWQRKENTFQHLHSGNSGLQDNGILCSLQDKQGILWLGTSGLIRYDPGKEDWRMWKCFSTKVNGQVNILSCIQDREGGIWLGSHRGGLFHFDPKKEEMEEVFLPEAAYDSLHRLRIQNMCLDPQGRIWIANHVAPIRLDPKTRKVDLFKITNAAPTHNTWFDVQYGSNDRLYVTSNGSFLEMDTTCQVLRQYNTDNGLKSNQLFFVEEDELGYLWFNTSYMLHRFDPKTGNFAYFGTGDGLFKNTISDGLNRTPDGQIFIGFQNAFNFFDPSSLKLNALPPPVVITKIKVMDEERRPVRRTSYQLIKLFPKSTHKHTDSVLVIRPGEEIFSIEFAALNFNQPERNRYAYMLEDFNNNWVPAEHNVATYTNLDEGEYLFRVKAANNDGVWNEAGAELIIKVIPKLPNRWYFKLIIGLVLGLLVSGVWFYRHRQRLRMEAFRESLARDLHDEMGSTLSSIRFFSEYAKQQVGSEKPEVTPLLQRISMSASALSDSMHDIIWAMKRKNDQLEDLAARMTEFGLRLLEARDIAFKTRIEEGFSGRSLAPELRRNLYLIFKEAINNAAKYAEASEVELLLSLKRGRLHMSITDNGKGFSGQPRPTGEGQGGNGLHNMKKRAEEIGGKFEIQSEAGQGSCVSVEVNVSGFK